MAALYTNTGSHRAGRKAVLPRSGSRHALHVAARRNAPRGRRPTRSDRQRPPVRQFVLRSLPPPHPHRRESAYGAGEGEQCLHLVAPCRDAGHGHRGSHADMERVSRLQAQHRRHLRRVSGEHPPAALRRGSGTAHYRASNGRRTRQLAGERPIQKLRPTLSRHKARTAGRQREADAGDQPADGASEKNRSQLRHRFPARRRNLLLVGLQPHHAHRLPRLRHPDAGGGSIELHPAGHIGHGEPRQEHRHLPLLRGGEPRHLPHGARRVGTPASRWRC